MPILGLVLSLFLNFYFSFWSLKVLYLYSFLIFCAGIGPLQFGVVLVCFLIITFLINSPAVKSPLIYFWWTEEDQIVISSSRPWYLQLTILLRYIYSLFRYTSSIYYQVALKNAPTLTVFKDTRYGIYVTFLAWD